MSLHQRVSANTGRRTSISHASAVPFGLSRLDDPSYSARLTGSTTAAAPSDYEQRLLDSLNTAHTELNKTNSERDRYLSMLEQANKKLAESTQANADLKSQNQALREQFQIVKEDKEKLDYSNEALEQDFADLQAKYNTLLQKYTLLSSTSPVGSSGSLPERPKLSRSSSKKERKEDREESSRKRDKEKSHRDREKEDKRERERERERDREREKEKEKEKEKKEQKAEKERLSRRFEGGRNGGPPPAPSANRRSSFIEGWGPGGRSSSSGSSNRSYTNATNGHAQAPAVSSPHKGSYSSVPRTAGNPMTPRVYNSPGSTAAVFDDDGSYEDGNYHPYPISR